VISFDLLERRLQNLSGNFKTFVCRNDWNEDSISWGRVNKDVELTSAESKKLTPTFSLSSR
jgi:hypothetical protein